MNLKPHLIELGWETVTVNDVLDRKAGNNSVSDDIVFTYAKEQKYVIVTKDKGLKMQCFNHGVPFIFLGSPEEEARIVDRQLKELQAWKEYL